MLLAYRLVRLIETHADRLAAGLLAKVQASDKCRHYAKVPPEEFRQRVYEIYDHLGEWLLGKKESDVARRYKEIGARREAQGVPISEVVFAMVLTREYLWEYLKDADIEKPAEVFGELELLQLLEQFFDRATYYAVVGYEGACQERGELSREERGKVHHGVGR